MTQLYTKSNLFKYFFLLIFFTLFYFLFLPNVFIVNQYRFNNGRNGIQSRTQKNEIQIIQHLIISNTKLTVHATVNTCIDVANEDVPIMVELKAPSGKPNLPYYYKLREFTVKCSELGTVLFQPHRTRNFSTKGRLLINKRKPIKSFRLLNNSRVPLRFAFKAFNNETFFHAETIRVNSCEKVNTRNWARYASRIELCYFDERNKVWTSSSQLFMIYNGSECEDSRVIYRKVNRRQVPYLHSGVNIVDLTLKRSKTKSFIIECIDTCP